MRVPPPEGIVANLTTDLHAARSYWIRGEAKTGRTSYLLQLESLLALHQRQHAIPLYPTLPLYVSCGEYKTLADLYRGLIARAADIDPHGRVSPMDRNPVWGSAPSHLPASQLLTLLLQDLERMLNQLSPQSGRLLLLVDEVECLLDQPWAGTFFGHLRALLTTPLPTDVQRVFLVITGSDRLKQDENFQQLLDVLLLASLGPFSREAMKSFFERTHRGFAPQELESLYRASGGQPWLCSYLRDSLVGSFARDRSDFFAQFDQVTGAWFQNDEASGTVLAGWLDRLDRLDRVLINRLIVDRDGASCAELAGALREKPSNVRKHIDTLHRLGLVFPLPDPVPADGVQQRPPPRFGLGEMFKHWYLDHTGGKALAEEIDRLHRPATPAVPIAAPASASLSAPFSLHVSLRHRYIVADGRCGAFCDLGEQFSDSLEDVAYVANTIPSQRGNKSKLQTALRQMARTLDEKFVSAGNWLQVWDDYFRNTESSFFLLRIVDQELLNFPVELIRFNNSFLGLQAAVAKEVMNLASVPQPAYHWHHSLFPSGSAVNVLVVASGREGDYAGTRFAALPHAEAEAETISGLLLKTCTGARCLAVGTVLVLSTGGATGTGVVPLTSETMGRALRGELGTTFQIVHFSGHAVFADRDSDDESGLLLPGDDGGLALYNLAMLRHDLERSPPALCYLNGCQSAQNQPDATMYLGPAHSCLTAGVPVVIGNRWPVGDQDAARFAEFFYTELAQGEPPEQALLAARKAAHQAAPDGVLWAAPVMLCR